MPTRAALTRRHWWSLRTGGFFAAGLAAGAVAWWLGPRGAIALIVGAGTAGGLLVLAWLRGRLRSLSTELAQSRASHRELQKTLDRRLSELEKRLRSDHSTVEKRLLAKQRATEERVLAEVSGAEKRLRTGASGDLVALEKRLRAVPPAAEVM